MLEYIRREANRTETENGGAAYATSGSVLTAWTFLRPSARSGGRVMRRSQPDSCARIPKMRIRR